MEKITKRFGFWIVLKYREIMKSYFSTVDIAYLHFSEIEIVLFKVFPEL